jgi:hypothetical protein
MADVRIRSGRNRAQTGWEPRRTYESEDDSADAVDFGNSEDSDGSYSSGEEEEDVIGAQPADYSSLELLQQLRENVRGAARVRGSSQNSTRENSQRERSQRQDSQLERSQRENSQVDNSQHQSDCGVCESTEAADQAPRATDDPARRNTGAGGD